MINIRKLLTITTLLVVTFIAGAQNLLTLNDVLGIAYQNSPDIKKQELSLERSREMLNAQRASLKSRFALDVNPFTYNQSRKFDEFSSSWYNSETMSSNGTFRIVQPIKATDGTISLVNTFGWQDSYSSNSNRNSNTFSNNVSVQFDQPIFTYNRTKLELRELELDLETTLLGFSIQKLNIEKRVSQLFYNVYQREKSLIISKEEYENQKKNFEIIKNKVSAGLSAEEELWQADLNLANAESSVYTSQVALENAKDQLKQSIGMPLNQKISIIANVDVDEIDIELDEAINYAKKQRLEIRQREIDIENSQFSLIRTSAINEFKGNVSLSVGLFGENQNIDQVYDSPTDNERVSLSFEIPLWDWGNRKSRIKAAEASLKTQEINYQDELINIEINIRQIHRNLKNLINQIKIAQKSVENAKKTYTLKVEEYENGDLTSMDLSLYQNQLSNKKNALTNALIDYKLELLNLKIQTLWDFETNKSIVPKQFIIN